MWVWLAASPAALAERLHLSPDLIDRLSALEVLRGSELDRATLRDRPVVVAFFASWCVPCRAGFVELRKLIDRRGADRIKVIAVNWLEDAGNYPGESFRLQRMLDRVAPHITVVAGDRATSDAFGSVTALPSLYVFDGTGSEAYRFKYDGISPATHPTSVELDSILADQGS